jgi:hypothetical protein
VLADRTSIDELASVEVMRPWARAFFLREIARQPKGQELPTFQQAVLLVK